MKPKTILTILLLIGLAVGGYYGYTQWQANRSAAQSNYQTEVLQRGQLTALVGGTGTVHADQTTLVAWQISGQISKIYVSVDDTVEKDQELARLETSSLPQSLILAEADLITAKRNLETLQTSTTQRAQAQLALVNAQDALKKAQDNYNWTAYERGSKDQIDAARANLVLAQDQLDKAEQYFGYVDDRPKDDPVYAAALLQVKNARTARDNAQANLNWLLGKPSTEDVALSEAKLLLAQAQLEDAQREWNRLKDGPDPDDITVAQVRINALEATLRQVVLRAPFSGTITEVRSQEGDQVSPGTVSFRIDDFSRFLVDVQIPEVDVNRIQIGQPVKVSFDAIMNKEYNGKITEISRVGTVTQGSVNFTVTIELIDADELVRPGMTAAVNIVVEQLDDVLLVPNRAVRLRNGERVIYLLRDGAAVAVPITIGATSDSYSQVLRGDVKAGDVVILNPPTEFDASRPPFSR